MKQRIKFSIKAAESVAFAEEVADIFEPRRRHGTRSEKWAQHYRDKRVSCGRIPTLTSNVSRPMQIYSNRPIWCFMVGMLPRVAYFSNCQVGWVLGICGRVLYLIQAIYNGKAF